MDDRIEDISNRIERWMKSNRMGESENDPYFWSIYEVSSLKAKPAKNAQTNSNNLLFEDLEESLDHLLNCMSNSIHIKYFFIRLRKEAGDTGIVNNFENPYYRTPYSNRSSIGNIPQGNQQESSIMMMMVGMINGMQEDRRLDRESTQAMITELKLQNQQHDYKLKEYKLKEENKRLQKENQAIGSTEDSFFKEILREIIPEIKDGIKYIAGGNTSYNDEDYEEEEEEEKGEQAKSNDKQDVLNHALKLLNSKVDNPVMLVYKMSVVLSNSEEGEANQLLGAVQAKFDQIKKSKSANNE